MRLCMGEHTEAVAQALELICSVERCCLVGHRDKSGRARIGYGLSLYSGGEAVQLKDVTSPPVAREEMRRHLERDILPRVQALPSWELLGQRRQAALLSFAQGIEIEIRGNPCFSSLLELLERGSLSPEALNRVGIEMKRYAADALGRLDPHLAERRAREAALWAQEDSSVLTFEAVHDTYLKKAPIDSRYLSDEGRHFIPKGTTIEVSLFQEIPRDGHDWITTDERWVIFSPHWLQAGLDIGGKPPEEVDWHDFSCLVGRYITVGEILRYDARRRPVKGSVVERNLIRLAGEFDAIRKAWGGPIMVTSGYRPEPINTEVGGVRGSRHVTGEALDIYPADGRLEDFHPWLKRRWSGGFGDGRPRGFIHIDTRDGGKFHPKAGVTPAAFWLY
ncbi:MAG: D-Ala-D-Ala carboxypeptidase family metallohydrolase [Cyanobium sp.]|nr:D-Ala-D-Ala carboxypeptidase family metallohydrolase [Cyanobium sp.]